MSQKENDKLRSSTLYDEEILWVIYTGDAENIPNIPIIARARSKKSSGLPYPSPKWIVCDYEIIDLDGESFPIANDRYGELKKGFKWLGHNEEV